MKIYEVRDTTNDEMYYPIGFFIDFDYMMNEIMGCKDPTDIMSGYNEYDWGATLEIIEHESEKWSEGKIIREYHWNNIYNDKIDDYEWGKATLINNRQSLPPAEGKED